VEDAPVSVDPAFSGVAAGGVAHRHDTLQERVLAPASLSGAILTAPETVAWVAGYSYPFEDWPVADPFVGGPAAVVVDGDEMHLLVPDCHVQPGRRCGVPVRAYRSYTYEEPADPFAGLTSMLEIATHRLGVEARALPLAMAEYLRSAGHELVAIDDEVLEARAAKTSDDLGPIRRAARLADVVQQAVKDEAAPGLTEAEVAGLAQSAMYREAGCRVPAVLTLTAGACSAGPTAEATGRPITSGDLVLTDTSPWIDGAWSDSANSIVVGKPSRRHVEVFDAVRRALDYAITACRPGVVSGDVDRRVREQLADFGPTYRHHTGHGIGAAWSEEPRIVPYNTRRIEEGMVLAVEPAVYIQGWGGIRLEDVFVVRATGNELLTRFEHTL
jgi:Xaa-Pro dipeptidase